MQLPFLCSETVFSICRAGIAKISMTRNTFYMERGICPIVVFYFALKHALSLTFKNAIG